MEFIVSASQFHPTTVTENLLRDWCGARFFLFPRTWDSKILSLPKFRSDKIESLVQELQSTGLGTSEEIYRVLIPPLSYFDKLPNEAVADWCNERLIGLEFSNDYYSALGSYVNLLEPIRNREVQDRFAKRAAAIVLGFFLRVIDDPRHKELSYTDDFCIERLRRLLKTIAQTSVLKAVLSLEHIIASQGKQKNYAELRNLPPFKALEQNAPGEDHLEEDDFNFPNATDVFGWTDSYWDAFKNGAVVKEGSHQILDLAGQSVLHHVIDETVDLPGTNVMPVWITVHKIGSSEILTARCNKQTPLHRAARAGHPVFVDLLLQKDADSNAAESFGRTAVFLAAYHRHSEVVNLLCDKMDHAGLNRTDEHGCNALHYAILNYQEIAPVLEQKKQAAGRRRKHNTALLENKEDAAVALIGKGIDINAVDKRECTPVWYAASEGMKRVVKRLLTHQLMDLADLTREGFADGLPCAPSYATKNAGHEEIAKMLRDAKKEKEKERQEKAGGKENDVDFYFA